VPIVYHLARFSCVGLLIVAVGALGEHWAGEFLGKRYSAREHVNEVAAHLPPALAAPGPTPSVESADRILVLKSEHTLTLLSHGKPIRVYKVALGSGGPGPKDHEGDRKTPEGTYIIDRKNSRTLWHLTLHISYPNAADRARADAEHLSPGGDIMIHGVTKQFEYLGATQADSDWTYGCIALSNPELDEVSGLVPIGTTIEIRH